MITRLLHVSSLILVTTGLHGLATGAVVRVAERLGKEIRAGRLGWIRPMLVPMLVLAMLFVSLVEANLWALYYWGAGYLASYLDSVYFSLITMTTVGYGDITLVGFGRAISGMQAALGIILFGWTTAIIFMVVQAVHMQPKISTASAAPSPEPSPKSTQT
jgi:hypothetical protein